MLLVGYVCSCYMAGSSPKKSTTVIGYIHKSMSHRVIGFDGLVKRCTVSCDCMRSSNPRSPCYSCLRC